MASAFPADVVTHAPDDPVFGLTATYRADKHQNKLDLGIGVYRDDNAKPWVPPVVKLADERLRQVPDYNHEYLPIVGLPEFITASQRVMLGVKSPAISEKRVATIQTISGTGAIHLGALFLSKFYRRNKVVYLSSPTWVNHRQIFTNVELPIETYPYFNHDTNAFDLDAMLCALAGAPIGSIIVLQVCAHNPTGADPTSSQWKEIAKIMKERNHFPFFDCAYQGFASGSLSNDGWAVRHFIEEGFELCVAQSFAKNLGLYGERVGCLHFVTAPAPDAQDAITRIGSQLGILQRCEISNPPAYGARIASIVLNEPNLFAEWENDLQTMSGRIISMRQALREKLEAMGTPGTWNHITDHIGMFSFTGLTETQVQRLREDSHIYVLKTGRISMAGLNSHNIDYFAKAVDRAVRDTQ